MAERFSKKLVLRSKTCVLKMLIIYGPVSGTESPVFCFAGHTDVVPTGQLDAWNSDPFCQASVMVNLWSWFCRHEDRAGGNGGCL